MKTEQLKSAAELDKIFKNRYANVDTSDLSNLFMNGPAQHARPLSRISSVALLPETYSLSPKFLNFTEDLSNECNDAMPIDLKDDGSVGPSCVHQSFNAIRSVSGYTYNPISFVPIGNDMLRKSLGLNKGWRKPKHIQLCKEFLRLIFSEISAENIKVTKNSTEGWPEFMKDPQHKKDYSRWMMSDWSMLDRSLTLSHAHNYTQLFNEHGVMFFSYLGLRLQPEDPTKQRIVMDYEYAVSGGERGSLFPADKTVTIDGVHYPNHCAQRSRVIIAAPWKANWIIQCVATPTLKSMFNRFPKTFHQTDIKEIAENQVSKKGAVSAVDVSDYDRTIPFEFFELIFEVMEEYWDAKVVEWIRNMTYSGYYTRPVDRKGKDGIFVGHPFKRDRVLFSGNKSGNGMTSLLAKLCMVMDTITIADDIFGNMLGNIKKFLNWELPYSVVNNGDDQLDCGSDQVVKLITDARTSKDSDGNHTYGYVSSAVEKGRVMSGSLIVDKPGGGFTAVKRIHTLALKQWNAERSVTDKMRPMWPIGFLDKVNVYGGADPHPAYDTYIRIQNDLWKKHFPDRPSILSIVTSALSSLPIPLAGLTAIDMEVLQDPDKIHYKYSEDDVSPHVMDLIVSKIQFEELKPFYARYYGGIINERKH